MKNVNMAETWLQANRRIFAVPIVAAFAIEAGAFIAIVFSFLNSDSDSAPSSSPLFWTWIALAAVFGLVGMVLLVISRVPRIAYADGLVKFYVRFGPPVEVPIEHVEAFLIGRGPVFFNDDRKATKETTTLLVRIAERATDYHHVTTAPLLAAWCGNQATIRGTWTEPLDLELVNRLNQRLYDVKQALADQAAGAGA